VTETAPAPPVPRWGLGAALLGWVSGTVCGGLFLAIWHVTTGQDERALGSLGVAQVGFWLGLLGAVLVTSRRGGTGRVADDFGLRARRRDVPVGLACGLACQLVLVPALYFPFRSLLDKHDLEQPARELADKAHGISFLVFAVVIAVGAPIVEELFFRGLVLRSLQRYLADVPAAIVCGVVFGASHFELLQLPALAAVGVVFALLVVRTGRLGPAIWAHIAFNATTVLLLALDRT
jgi:membrane protease YdiL (CAAX protease family)